MKVLVVHNFYQQYGGEDAVVRAEVELLNSRGHAARLFSRHNDEIKSFGLGSKFSFPLYTVNSPATLESLPRVLQEFKPDVAYLHNLYPLLSPAVYSVLASAGVPTVQMIHNFRPFCSNGFFLSQGEICERCLGGGSWNGVLRRCFRDSYALSAIYAAATTRGRQSLAMADLLLCPSEFVRDKFIEAGVDAHKIRLRPNSIDTRAIRPSPRPGEYALFMGRLSREKGLLTLLSAFRGMPDRPLVIAGTGPVEQELRDFVSTHRMGNVRFAGFASGAAKWDLLENAAFVVLPSEWYEIGPMAVPEAFAKARPILGSRIGSIPGLVQDGETGLLFEMGSPDDLERRAQELFANLALRTRLGLAARRTAERRYDSKLCFDLLLQAFDSAVERYTARAAC